MHTVTDTTLWASIGIAASAIGGLFTIQLLHSSSNGHTALVDKSEFSDVKVRVERVAAEVSHNRALLNDLKVDIRHIKNEQDQFNKEVLEAIRGD